MVRVGWLVLVTACGRLGFAEQPADTGATGPGDGSATSPGCPASYQTIDSQPSRYFVAGATATYDQGVARCATDGTRMLIVDDAEENSAILIHAAGEGLGAMLWVGIAGNNQAFVTVEGGTPSYLPWATGSPGAPTADTAAAMRLLNPEAGRFVTFSRGTTPGVVTYCECTP